MKEIEMRKRMRSRTILASTLLGTAFLAGLAVPSSAQQNIVLRSQANGQFNLFTAATAVAANNRYLFDNPFINSAIYFQLQANPSNSTGSVGLQVYMRDPTTNPGDAGGRIQLACYLPTGGGGAAAEGNILTLTGNTSGTNIMVCPNAQGTRFEVVGTAFSLGSSTNLTVVAWIIPGFQSNDRVVRGPVREGATLACSPTCVSPDLIGGVDSGGVVRTVVVDSTGSLKTSATFTPSGTQNVNLIQVASTNTVTGGLAGLLGVGGATALGATASGNPFALAGFNPALALQNIAVGVNADGVSVTPAANTAFLSTALYARDQSAATLSRVINRSGSLATIGVFTAADALSNTLIGNLVSDGAVNPVAPLQVAAMDFNGTTWDRKRGNTNGSFAQGPAARNTAIAGNPVWVGGWDGANVQSLSVALDGVASTNLSVKVGGIDTSGNQRTLMTGSGGVGATGRILANTDGGNTPNDSIAVTSFERGDSAQTSNSPFFTNTGLTSFTTAQSFPACEQQGIVNSVGAATTQIVALTSAQSIRICSLFASNLNTTATTVKLVQGTGTNCATGQTDLTSLFNLQTNAAGGADLFAQTFPHSGLKAISGNAVCVTSSAAGSVSATVTFSKF